MPRFVILEHDYPELHWDFMLEHGPALKTWRLAKAPEKMGEIIDALPLQDHRLLYLNYEGPISGKRGTVTRWDAGEYESLAEEEGQAFHILLNGKRIQGVAVMEWHFSGWAFRFDDRLTG